LAIFALQVVGFGTWIPLRTAEAQDAKKKKSAAEKKESPKKTAAKDDAKKIDVNLLSMEVAALEALRDLQLTPDQMKALAKTAKKTRARAGEREKPKAAGGFIKTMTEMREALVKNDESRRDVIQRKLDKLWENKPPELDDEVEITDAARDQVQAVVNLLTANQIASKLGDYSEDSLDPVQVLSKGLEDNGSLKGEDWTEARDSLADEVCWLVAGADRKESERLRTAVTALLDEQHRKKAGKDFERKALAIVGKPNPFAILKNKLEHDLAELLSNPQLGAAINACLDETKR